MKIVITESQLHVLNEKLTLGSKERIHLTTKPISSFDEITSYPFGTRGKPSGLWYGFGDSWIEFKKKSISPKSNRLKDAVGDEIYIYKLYLDTSNILTLNTIEDYINFTEEYGMDEKEMKSKGLSYPYNIDWNMVKDDYRGVEFPTYSENIKTLNYLDYGLDLYWIWGIEVDSGCVWDSSVIKKVKSI
jgi:hypothetical protein